MQTIPRRWFGVGQSSAPDSAKAGAEAAREAIDGRTPKAVFVFAALNHDHPALLTGVRSETGPDVVVVGATTNGELGSEGASKGGVSVAALGGDGFEVGSRMALIPEVGRRVAGERVAEALQDVGGEHRVLIMLVDAHTESPHEIIRGVYSVVGASVPLVGGFAGDDLTYTGTSQMYGDDVVQGAVVGVALSSDAPIGIGIAHGWHRIEPPMIISRSQGGRIYQLDDQPALDVLRRRNNFEGTADEFFANGRVLQPLGLSRRNGEDIRVIHAGSDDDRSVWGTADVNQGALVWPMHADHDDMVKGARDSCTEAVAGLEGVPPIGALTFDCAGRRLRLVEDGGIDEEIATMRDALGNAPFAGFYTSGEIARVRGATGMHHLTLVTLALA